MDDRLKIYSDKIIDMCCVTREVVEREIQNAYDRGYYEALKDQEQTRRKSPKSKPADFDPIPGVDYYTARLAEHLKGET